MVFEIEGPSGYVDILPYVAYDGLKYQRSALDGPNTTRTMDGILHRDKISDKDRWDITCRLLKLDEVATLLQLLEPEFFHVRYTSPVTNTVVEKTMYSNNIPMTLALAKIEEGITYWESFTFPLIEQ